MANRRDFTNQYGAQVPTETAALYRAEKTLPVRKKYNEPLFREDVVEALERCANGNTCYNCPVWKMVAKRCREELMRIAAKWLMGEREI